jgi:deoxyribodipyrimidine photolyase
MHTVPETPHPSDLEARPRKPHYSLLKQPEPALTTSPDDHEHNKLEDVSAAPKHAGRVANWNILGTFSWTKAENYLEERDSVQHAGLLGEVNE